jgi:tetratricopeptide (TPR) repeat protein
MNRAEKRRQRKLSKKAARKSKPVQPASSSTRQQTPTIQQAIDIALQHHNADRLPEAERIYQQILQADPDQPVALHLLGVIAYQTGENSTAVDLITKALAIKPDYADAHSNLGNALKEQGKLDEAVASYHKALAIKPDFAEAHSNLGAALKQQGKLNEAVASFHKALAIKTDYAEAHSNLGNALKKQGKLDEAVASFHKALAIKPDYAEAHSNLGNTLQELGKLDEAVASYHKALAIKPDYAETWNNLNLVTKALRFSKADGERTEKAFVNGLSDVALATSEFAILQFYLDKFRPHEADESFETVIAALPAMADEAVPIGGTDHEPVGTAPLPDKMVALLRFGRSGTGLLHSLIDGHPEISTLPGVYLRGYFNQGVWGKLSADGWRGLPERFADEFAVLFDARTSKPIPSLLSESPFFIGEKEGMTSVGENRDEFLSVDREVFCGAASRLMEGMESVDPMSFLNVVHGAFEEAIGSTGEPGTNKHLCFYHIHNPDDYAKPNFIRYAANTRLLMTVREPVQNCESTIRVDFKENDYVKSALQILGMLFDIDQILFRMRDSVGIRLEDLKARPEATIQALCAWLGVEDSPTLYEMTAQGKKWWGDPSSPDYGKDKAMSPFDAAATKRPIGAILGEKDQFILGTLFYPFSVRFGYRESDPEQFQKDLKEIRPLLDDMLDFEKTMAARSNIDHGQFKQNGTYQLLRAGFVDRWAVLDELGTYPHMLTPLDVTAS